MAPWPEVTRQLNPDDCTSRGGGCAGHRRRPDPDHSFVRDLSRARSNGWQTKTVSGLPVAVCAFRLAVVVDDRCDCARIRDSRHADLLVDSVYPGGKRRLGFEAHVCSWLCPRTARLLLRDLCQAKEGFGGRFHCMSPLAWRGWRHCESGGIQRGGRYSWSAGGDRSFQVESGCDRLWLPQPLCSLRSGVTGIRETYLGCSPVSVICRTAIRRSVSSPVERWRVARASSPS
jgi:hypothetical protein